MNETDNCNSQSMHILAENDLFRKMRNINILFPPETETVNYILEQYTQYLTFHWIFFNEFQFLQVSEDPQDHLEDRVTEGMQDLEVQEANQAM